ncbi:MAG: DUF1559 domain-containing protein [Fibrella sp.]|nr:DUF1559 domain-containing protein [Armatimonadota bacterium]
MRRNHAFTPAKRASGAFTLIELLTVIAIIALLAAIIFPVFATVRGKARATACQSNLRQLGTATQMYMQDYDGIIPFGKDASDAYVPAIWSGNPACAALLKDMPFLHFNSPVVSTKGTDISPEQEGVLNPYTKNRDIWKCAGDTGFDFLDNNDNCAGPCPLDARPSMYEAFGASYLTRTELAFKQINVDSVKGTTFEGKEVGPSQIQFLFDGNGSWHGSPISFGRSGRRYIMLYLDGHVKNLTYDQYQEAWGTSISVGSSTPSESPCL